MAVFPLDRPTIAVDATDREWEHRADEADILVRTARGCAERLRVTGDTEGHRHFADEADRLASAARAIRGGDVALREVS
jgi:hypothetical protein